MARFTLRMDVCFLLLFLVVFAKETIAQGGTCYVVDLGISIREGEFASTRLDNFQQACRVYSCEDIGFGVGLILLNVNCSNYAEENCARYEGFDREASTCCCKCDDSLIRGNC